MLKQRSSVEASISDYFFAVYPVSLQFDRDYKTKFQLYFEKNLQIISKHESPLPEVKKDQVAQFPVPQQLHHFRIQSQKNLDYQWSLYIFRVDMEGDNEQFIESQKISLKDAWSVYKSRRVSLSQQAIRFNTIRCKLSFVIIIANNSREVLDLAQKHFTESKMSVITTDEKIVTEPQRSVQPQKMEEPKHEIDNFVEKHQPKVEENIEELKLEHSSSKPADQQLRKLEEMRISDIIYKGRGSLQSQMQNRNFENLLTPRDEQDPKLSNSEMDIGRQIQEKVTSKQNSLKGQAILVEQDHKIEAQNEGNNKKLSVQTQEKNIRMTNSQILNDQKQVIVPLYKQKKFVAFLLLIILILGGGVWTLSSAAPQPINNKKTKKTKQTKQPKQAKKEAPSKKAKGKK